MGAMVHPQRLRSREGRLEKRGTVKLVLFGSTEEHSRTGSEADGGLRNGSQRWKGAVLKKDRVSGTKALAKRLLIFSP